MLSLGEHGVCQVNADDPALGTDFLLEQWEVEAGAAGDLDDAGTRAQSERLDCSAAVGPLGLVELGGDVVVPGCPAVCLDQMLSVTVDLAHRVSLGRILAASRCITSR